MCSVSVHGLVAEWGGTLCFGLLAESLSLCTRKEKVTKEKARPVIRPRLRRGSLAPAPLRGPP